ncbi:MAG: preprotein translocase subunit SecY [Lewinellaceae bacterium]|nr:preprotein translocase subunit SecY [Saprospiraceae bacterium]MCB9314867.1 preprotein translocase subunit SecY [Lewinellaceae bacterium]MCB9333040.1 preprotein translocase subunit SecY [Lewinellaceae bacterium]
MKLIRIIKNIWNIKELRERILFTLLMLFIFRVGTFVVLPGVIPAAMAKASQSRGANDLLGLINTFTGGAFDNAAVLALGVMPYITASIIVQLLGFAVPYFQRLQTREGESGRKRLNQITRLLTVAITLVQGGGYLQLISSTPGAVSPNIPEGLFWFSNIIILTAGTIFSMWLGERITDKGIGNGVSLIIMIGIIARLPQSFVFEFQKLFGDSQLLLFFIEMAGLFVVVLATVLVIQGVRRIPIQFAKRMVGRTGGGLPQSSARDYLPMKVNSAGVMPIIFAQALMFLPATVYQYLMQDTHQVGGRIHMFNDIYSFGYNLVFFILIVVFTYVYTALMINPTNYAEYLKRSNAFIPGVKPGEATASYIDNIMTRITLPGSVFLGLIGILPSIAASLGVNQQFALFFGGTSLLIMVGVALDTLQVIESYLLTKKYDGLIKSGRIQGRASQGLQIGQPQ